MRNVYVFSTKVVDVAKVREEAVRRARPSKTRPGEATTIHHHALAENCGKQKHENFEAKGE